MGVVHFLNVKNGDCSVIQHSSGRVSVIDICNGNDSTEINATESFGLQGNHNQKNNPINPIDYIAGLELETIHRFILTHPDMDHMDGIEKLFNEFNVINLWDTKNNKKIISNDFGSYNSDDWEFYQKRRKEGKTLNLLDGASGIFYNQDDDGGYGDFLQILCPTQGLIDDANESGNYNDASYVILYNEAGRKILFTGDSEDYEWDVLLERHEEELRNIDVLIAPHHGRKSGGNDEFLDVLKPKLTLFGNAKSKDLNYDAWNNRNLEHFTNNEGGTFILKHNDKDGDIDIYCTYENFAKRVNSKTIYFSSMKAWYIGSV